MLNVILILEHIRLILIYCIDTLINRITIIMRLRYYITQLTLLIRDKID